eukprot:13390308-Alexandrium_andersonii.AAC.1
MDSLSGPVAISASPSPSPPPIVCCGGGDICALGAWGGGAGFGSGALALGGVLGAGLEGVPP